MDGWGARVGVLSRALCVRFTTARLLRTFSLGPASCVPSTGLACERAWHRHVVDAAFITAVPS